MDDNRELQGAFDADSTCFADAMAVGFFSSRQLMSQLPYLVAEVNRQADEAGMRTPRHEKFNQLYEQKYGNLKPRERNVFLAIGNKSIDQFEAAIDLLMVQYEKETNISDDPQMKRKMAKKRVLELRDSTHLRALVFAQLVGFQAALDFYWEHRDDINMENWQLAIVTNRSVDIVVEELGKIDAQSIDAIVYIASVCGRLDIIQHFVESEKHEFYGDLVHLTQACRFGHEAVVQYFIQKGVLSFIGTSFLEGMIDEECVVHGRRNILKLLIYNQEKFDYAYDHDHMYDLWTSVFAKAAKHKMYTMMCDILHQRGCNFYEYYRYKPEGGLEEIREFASEIKDEKTLGELIGQYICYYQGARTPLEVLPQMVTLRFNHEPVDQVLRAALELLAKIVPLRLYDEPTVQDQAEMLNQLHGMAITNPHVNLMISLTQKYLNMRMLKQEAQPVETVGVKAGDSVVSSVFVKRYR